jgi:hypothetical protein
MRPEVLVTMDPASRGGQHGHHQVAGRLATEAFVAAADAAAFREQIRDEGLRPWRVRKLYYGARGEGALQMQTRSVSPARGRSYAEIAREALRHHRSQGFDRFLASGLFREPRPESFLLVKSRVSTPPERETDLFDGCDDRAVAAANLEVRPERDAVPHNRPFQVALTLTNHDDLPFRDVELTLSPPDGTSGWRVRPLATPGAAELASGKRATARFEVTPAGFAPGSVARLEAEARWVGEGSRLRGWAKVRGLPRVEVAFRPSAQTQEYRRWARRQRLEWLVDRLPARAPLQIGGVAPVIVEVTNHGGATASGQVRLRLPHGWTSQPATGSYRCPPRATQEVRFAVRTPPAQAQGEQEITVSAPGGAGQDRARAEPLPVLRARRLAGPMPVDANVRKWLGNPQGSGRIPGTAIVQGRLDGPYEAGARFFVGADDAALQVLVEVTDDTVVRNIASDDIRAHWRTTSVEICVDPAPKAENTLRTLKLGIFPQDLSGRVRAARDADANPGPVDRVDRGIRLASQRTEAGYVVEARIPFRSLPGSGGRPFRPRPGQTIGFNVILYHAGKQDAAIGEDVNKARLAWAYSGGVWGRPSSWGTLVLP